MSSNFGKCIKMQLFGESHGEAVGVVLDGIPSDFAVDMEKIRIQMDRRAPGRDKSSTKRYESDEVKIISGMLNGKTTGMPLCAMIANSDQHSSDYDYLKVTPRPSHADFPAIEKYGNFDVRGSGHFSGRLTAPLTFAGALLRQMLEQKGIVIGAHIASVGHITDTPFDKVNVQKSLLCELNTSSFAVIDKDKQQLMRNEIEKARLDCDSIGGRVEIAVIGLPVGIGEPMFGGVESVISAALFGIPAVKGISFGAGFDISQMRGSQANDSYYYDNGTVKTRTNNNGGILGGITTSMPVIIKVALKPTPSIGKQQNTVNLDDRCDSTVTVHGRHDPCIVPRAVAALESAVAVALADLMKEGGLL